MRSTRRWWRFALAPLAVSMALSTSIPAYVFADGTSKAISPSMSAQVHYAQGINYYSDGKYDAAVKSLTQAIAAAPSNPDYYSARANAYVQLGQMEQARSDYAMARNLAKGSQISEVRPTAYYQQSDAQAAEDQPQTPQPQAADALPVPEAAAEESPLLQSAPQAAAAEAPAASSGINLAGLLAARATAAPQNVGAPTASVTAEQASFLTPQSTGELLQAAPSVNTRRTSAINLDPRIRGFNSSQLVATADGMNQLKARQDIDSLFSSIDPGIVENVEIIDGPYTSLYGLGYGFLIADLFATQRSALPEFHGSTVFTQDSNGRDLYFRQNVRGSGADWGFYASGGLRTGNDYRPGDDATDYRIPGSYRKGDGFVTLSLDLTDNSRIEASYLRTELNNAELAGVVYDINYAENEQFNVRYVVQDCMDEPERFVLQYWWNRTPFHGDSTREAKQRTFTSTFIRNNYLGNAFDNANLGTAFDPNLDLANTFVHGATQSTGVRALSTWGDSGEVQLTAGVDYRRYTQQYQEVNFNFNGDNFFGPTAVFGIPDSSMEDYGVFTNIAIPVTEDITLTTGGRIDSTRAFVNENDPAFFPGTLAGKPNEILGMVYGTAKVQWTDAVSSSLGVAYGQRNPTLTELYAGQPFVPLVRYGNSFVTGNSELTPERNLQFDFGVTGEWENVVFTARTYYSNIENYILYYVSGDGDFSVAGAGPFTSLGYTYTNLDRASLYGGDAIADVTLLRGLALTGSMSYTRGTNHSPVLDLNRDGVIDAVKDSEGLPNIFPLVGRVGIRLFDPDCDRWGISFITRMVHGQDYLADSLFELPTDGYTICDVRGYFRVSDNLRLTGAVENIFDRVYTQHGSLVINDVNGNVSFVKEPGITFLAGAEFTY